MSNQNEHNATQVEPGWRSSSEKSERNTATCVDAGWRNQPELERKPAEEGEQCDNNSDAHMTTQIDAGWRKEIDEMLSVEDVLNDSSSNHFSTIDEFRDSVEKITELKSSKGTIYSVKKTISKSGGESIVLLCSDPNGNDIAAKVYYLPVNGLGSSISSRSRVLEYMGTEEGKRYTLAVTEIGIVELNESKYYFEIMPYCDGADLSRKKDYSFDQLVEITRQLNEALHSIHQAGIIHRDIKPENIYFLNGRYVIGDFGIAKAVVSNAEGTKFIPGTEGYRAPESTRYLTTKKGDYYSFGITLATLFEGHFVFEKHTFEQQSIAQEYERIPLQRIDPNREQFENLINGLCRISSKQRFGYEEVKLWLADHNYVGIVSGEEWPRGFHLLDDIYYDEKSMFYGFTKDEAHWESAKEELYSKNIEHLFSTFRNDISTNARNADEVYHSNNRDKGLSVFLKKLFPPGPIVWRGATFNGLSDLGEKMVATKTPTAYGQLLINHCVSHWLKNTDGIKVDDETIKLVDSIEGLSSIEPEIACYWFGNSFAPKKKLNICNSVVTTFEELINVLFSSPKIFYNTDGYHKLVDRFVGADLYGFLYSFGFKEIIETEWENLSSCDLFNKTSILFSMLDNIAIKTGANTAIIRSFFAVYGPIGLATYTKKLVQSNVYMPLDNGGKQLLDRILCFENNIEGTVDEIFRANIPLVESIDRLQRSLVDNPYCILTGVYENKGVICKNLVGCFAFNIFDRVAPLGFNALIDEVNVEVRE